MASTPTKPRLSLGRIIQMNLGFLGLQFSFGLQQSNMGPIYGYLGADEATLPLLWLAGPMTGLIVQPIVLRDHAWICARASVAPGTVVHEGAIVAMGQLASGQVPEWTITRAHGRTPRPRP